MDKNKVKIELYKSKVNAKFSHYVSGNLYYTVQMEDGIYQFPISTVQHSTNSHASGMGDPIPEMYHLSEDLGTTAFAAEIKASELNRWISKAIDKGDFVKIG